MMEQLLNDFFAVVLSVCGIHFDCFHFLPASFKIFLIIVALHPNSSARSSVVKLGSNLIASMSASRLRGRRDRGLSAKFLVPSSRNRLSHR